MARAFEQVVNLHLDRLSPEAAKRRHIEVARAGLAAFMARQSSPPAVRIEVDGRLATSEDAVRPFGVIVYRFARMREIVRFALGEAERLSPNLSGRYRRSWFAMINGREVGLDAIPADAEVTITNDQPYSRKINVGAPGFERYVPPGVVEKVRQLVFKRYASVVDANIVYLTLADGYVLKGHRPAAAAKQNRRSSAFRAGRSTLTRRRDTAAGADMTYPSLVIRPKH